MRECLVDKVLGQAQILESHCNRCYKLYCHPHTWDKRYTITVLGFWILGGFDLYGFCLLGLGRATWYMYKKCRPRALTINLLGLGQVTCL